MAFFSFIFIEFVMRNIFNEPSAPFVYKLGFFYIFYPLHNNNAKPSESFDFRLFIFIIWSFRSNTVCFNLGKKNAKCESNSNRDWKIGFLHFFSFRFRHFLSQAFFHCSWTHNRPSYNYHEYYWNSSIHSRAFRFIFLSLPFFFYHLCCSFVFHLNYSSFHVVSLNRCLERRMVDWHFYSPESFLILIIKIEKKKN